MKLSLITICILLYGCIRNINFYSKTVYELKLNHIAFQEPVEISFYDGTTRKLLFTKIQNDSITIVDLSNKNADPVKKTISLSKIKYLRTDDAIYTFEKNENHRN